MNRVEINHPPLVAEFSYDDGPPFVLGDPSQFTKLLQLLLEFHDKVPLVSFTFKPIPGVPREYRYKFTTVDGREFSQRLWFDIASDPLQTFDVDDRWRLTEFNLHRAVRDETIRLHTLLGLQTCVVTFESG